MHEKKWPQNLHKRTKICYKLTGNQDENWLDIYRSKLNRHLRDRHRSNRDCDHDLVADSKDAEAFCSLDVMLLDCLVAELMPVSAENSYQNDLKLMIQ